MKKGIVLLVSLFFIATISILVLKNLDDTDKILEQKNYKLDFSQALLLTKNIQKEIQNAIKNNKNNFEELLEDGVFESLPPFDFQGIRVSFSLDENTKEDINELSKNYVLDDLEKDIYNLRSYLEVNNIYDYPILQELYETKVHEDEKIKSSKQVEDIINNFIIRTYSNKINDLKDNIGFTESYKDYILRIKVSMEKDFLKSYYLLDKEGQVKYFEISFK
ncbi:hypothetical protein CP965_10350 [Halarcobacter mediterraneus]|uniref:Uncharacterized protein n=1 Tax=Halarcobacter mediterraneus TaxID=2023153 RepID=A0A4Q1AUE7_9BACT|nr:hypothetical protein [Halarcobacter mediterraneus]RXK12170.1 hypothetical protein CP965_10350 [Halarcobacter mediterraneus]